MQLQYILLIIGLYVVFGLLEKRYAAEKGHTLSDKLTNIFYGVLLLSSGILIVGFLYSIIPLKARHLPRNGTLFSIWIAIVYFLASDFLFYWYHRAQHYFKYFWVIHELHHSDRAVNVTTSMRTYWLERPLQTFLIIVPIYYIVGIDSLAVKLYFSISTLWLFFTHANLKLRLGILTPIIAGPQIHRIHHSNLPEHQGKNLAQFFPFFDILFGTYYHPAYNEFPTTGLTENDTHNSFVDVLLKPFKTWLHVPFGSNK
ncbi:sterol desaturase family protein [Parasediminibacterium paludis]|uniref:Sterol desaturase family protein n=1 Tax=Parasediminibacterium paludis TaxID=908966 RepID=A0ABV8PZN7_9BACT